MSERRSIVSAVIAAADRGEPLSAGGLLRFDAADVRRAFDAGEILKGRMRRGGQDLVVILPAPPDEDDSAWTADELSYLELAYTSGVTFGEMARALGRSGGQILQQAWRMKIERVRAGDGWESTVPAWRVRRLRALIDEARERGSNPKDDGAGIAHRALRRAFDNGRADLADDACNHQRWSEDDVAQLRALREEGRTIVEIARQLRRRRSGVQTKCSEIGSRVQTAWSADEDRILVAGIERGMTLADVSAFLPGRSRLACKCRAYGLLGRRGFEFWSEEETAALRQAVARGDNLKTFAAGIGRTVGAVRWRCRYLGLVHPNSTVPKTFSPAEDRRIAEGWARREKVREIAHDLGRPLRSIYQRAFKLGVTGRRPHGHHGPKVRRFEVEYIRARVEQGWTAAEIAPRIRRSYHMVYQIAARNGIVWPRRRRRAGVAAEAAA